MVCQIDAMLSSPMTVLYSFDVVLSILSGIGVVKQWYIIIPMQKGVV